MKIKLISLLVLFASICHAANENLQPVELDKFSLSWISGDAKIDREKGNLKPTFTFHNGLPGTLAIATLDLSSLSLDNTCAVCISVAEGSCPIVAPKRKNGLGHVAHWGIEVLYYDLQNNLKTYSYMYQYNYFEEKNKQYCEAKYKVNNGDWTYINWKDRVANFSFSLEDNKLRCNNGLLVSNVKSIVGIQIGIDNNAYVYITDFSVFKLSNSAQISQLLQEANNACINGDFKAAIDITTQILTDYDTNNIDALYYRAIALANSGYYKSAIIDFQKALDLVKNIPETPYIKKSTEEVHFMLGRCKMETGDMKGAIEDFKQGGFQGEVFIRENNLESLLLSNNNALHRNIPASALNEISLSNSSTVLSSTTIFDKYNNAVFMILIPGKDGTSQGSGFFVSPSGIAISNYHVFEDAVRGTEEIKLMNGGTYKIKEILGYDKEKDFIVFRVDGNGFSYIPVTKRGFNIGDRVFAIGSPRGMRNTLSDGLVSQIWDDTKFQISVPIDHGSSGGALINQHGEVIGITSGGRDDSHANLNYAVDIRRIFDKK